jgi:hypothetical protein
LGDLFGITADGWIAIATFVSGGAILAGIWYGARQLIREQEARDVRRYLIEDGAWKLQASLDRLLQVIRLNYVTAGHLLRIVRDLPRGHPGAPRLEDLPSLLPLEATVLNFEAIRPTSRLLDCEDFGALMTHAFAVLYNIHADFLLQVEHSIRTYYSADQVPAGIEAQLLDSLGRLLVERYRRAEEFGDLPGWLEDAALRAQELHLARFTDITRIRNDDTIKRLAQNMTDMWQRERSSHRESPSPGGSP